MGLFATVARVLGLVPPIEPHEPGPLALTKAGRERVARLPDGQVLNVATRPAEGGRVVQVQEGAALGAVDPALGIAILPADKEHLHGLELDWDGHRWAVKLSLRVEAYETPNPDGRLYLLDRPLADGRPQFFTGRSAAPPLATRVLAIDGVLSALFRENTVTVERERGAAWALIDRAVDAAVREHFLLCGHALRPEDRPQREDPLEEEVERVIREQIAPGIHRDGGDIELVEVREGVVRVHMVGACRTCPASATTLKLGVEATLKQAFPGRIERVEQT